MNFFGVGLQCLSSSATAQPVETHLKNLDFADGFRALVDVDLSNVSGKTKRVNITLPEHLLSQIDSFAAKTGLGDG